MFRQPLLLMLATIVQHLLLCLVLLNELGALCPDTSKNSQLHIVTNLRWNFECAVLNAYCIEHTLPHARTGCAELLRRHAAVGGVSATSTCTCSDGIALASEPDHIQANSGLALALPTNDATALLGECP